MATIKNQFKADWIVGSWRYNEAVSPILFTIRKTPHGFQIQAVDESDGEELLVSKIKWDGNALNFETLTPSNKWRTRNRLTAISNTKALHELTFWEDWEKVPAPVPSRKRKN
jgi:hypothetical protein